MDTYAIYELISQNPSYDKFDNQRVFTSKLNLMELFYGLGKVHLQFADKFYEFFKNAVEEINDEIIKDAMIFRIKNKKKKLSYADCIGYTIARKNGCKFVTGDNQFKEIEGVEFVK